MVTSQKVRAGRLRRMHGVIEMLHGKSQVSELTLARTQCSPEKIFTPCRLGEKNTVEYWSEAKSR